MVWISRLFLAEGNGSEYRAAILEHPHCPAGRRQHAGSTAWARTRRLGHISGNRGSLVAFDCHVLAGHTSVE